MTPTLLGAYILLAGTCVIATSVTYKVFPDLELSWDMTKAFCEKNGWSMVSIQSDYVAKLLRVLLESYRLEYWIGLRYYGNSPDSFCQSSSFLWSNCVTMTYQNLKLTSHYCYQAHCAYVKDLQWELASCQSTKNVVCQHQEGSIESCFYTVYKTLLIDYKTTPSLQLNAYKTATFKLSQSECRNLCAVSTLSSSEACCMYQYLSTSSCRLYYCSDEFAEQLLAIQNNTDLLSQVYNVKRCAKAENMTGRGHDASTIEINSQASCSLDQGCYYSTISQNAFTNASSLASSIVDMEGDISDCISACDGSTSALGHSCSLINRISSISNMCRLYYLQSALPHDYWMSTTEAKVPTLFVKLCPRDETLTTQFQTTTQRPIILNEIIIKDLLKDKTETSNYRRRFISVYESRPSAVSMGVCGSLFIGIIIAVIVFSDCPYILSHIRTIGARNIRKRNICRRTQNRRQAQNDSQRPE